MATILPENQTPGARHDHRLVHRRRRRADRHPPTPGYGNGPPNRRCRAARGPRPRRRLIVCVKAVEGIVDVLARPAPITADTGSPGWGFRSSYDPDDDLEDDQQ